MNRAVILFAAVAFVIGCSSPAPVTKGEATTSQKAASTAPFKVALLTPGPVSDAGWSAMAFEGLQQIEAELGAEVDNQEASSTEIRDAMRSYAQKGYRIVFGHGFEYNEPAVEIAADFPDTVFVSSSGGKTAPNAGAFRFYLEQGFYLAGVMAAKMSKTGTIGSVAVSSIPSIMSTIKAFEAGAKATRPEIKIVPTVFFGVEGDIAAAKQATLQVIGQGADFVIHQANAAAQGVFDAARDRNVYAIGSNLNQNDNASGRVIASAIIKAGPAFVDLAKSVKEGRFEGSVVLMGMDKGAIDFVLNPAMEAAVPEDVKKRLEEVRAEILSGDLVVPKDEF